MEELKVEEKRLDNHYREIFLKAISEVCFLNAEFPHIAGYAVRKLEDELPYDFNPLKYLIFDPVYSFEVNSIGQPLLSNNICDNLLFEQTGHLLYAMQIREIENSCKVCERYELWLLSNMKLAVVYHCNIMESIKYGTTTVSYRSRVKGGIDKIKELFDIEKFLKDIIEDALLSMYGEDDDEEDDECLGDCSICQECSCNNDLID